MEDKPVAAVDQAGPKGDKVCVALALDFETALKEVHSEYSVGACVELKERFVTDLAREPAIAGKIVLPRVSESSDSSCLA